MFLAAIIKNRLQNLNHILQFFTLRKQGRTNSQKEIMETEKFRKNYFFLPFLEGKSKNEFVLHCTEKKSLRAKKTKLFWKWSSLTTFCVTLNYFLLKKFFYIAKINCWNYNRKTIAGQNITIVYTLKIDELYIYFVIMYKYVMWCRL